MNTKRSWEITVLGDRSDGVDVVRSERSYGTDDEVIERACVVMGSEFRADVTPV